MSYFPILLEMNGRRALVIGGGAVAERKVATLLEAGAQVTVISPEITEGIARRSKQGSLNLIARRYQNGDLAAYELVFVATDDEQISVKAYSEGRERGIWVNAADDPKHCDFILPSVLRRGDLTVAVSSGGGSPALARTIREELEMHMSQDYEQLAKLAAEARAELRKRSLTVPFETWRKALSGDVRQFLLRGDFASARSHLFKELGIAL